MSISNRPRPPRGTGRFLFESLLIVISIVLGLGLNEWRQDRADMELADTALQSCLRELKENREKVSRRMPIHSQVWDQLKVIAAREGTVPSLLTVMAEIMPEHGLQLPSLDRVAWETAQGTGALRHMPYEDVSRLSELYNSQSLGLTATVGRLSDRVFSHRSFAEDGNEETLMLLILLFQELVSQEEYYLKVCDELLGEIEN